MKNNLTIAEILSQGGGTLVKKICLRVGVLNENFSGPGVSPGGWLPVKTDTCITISQYRI